MRDVYKYSPFLWAILWAALIISTLIQRPILPIDETRYLSVAWEMWLREDYLIPYLNGSAYSHKPPLLFWLIILGWKVFGVIEWWPRIVAPLFSLGCLFLTAHLGKRLWPSTTIFLIAPLLLLGSFIWAIFSTLTMFDLLVCFWTLIGLNGLLNVKDKKEFIGWLQFSIAIGLGILSKGPIVLIFLIPTAILAPYWLVNLNRGFVAWYVGVVTSLIVGIIIALMWAIPAGISGGEIYRNSIFWDQSAGRVISSFAHGKPFWWYLVIFPGLVLPWIIWPTLIKHLYQMISQSKEIEAGKNLGLRFTAVWIISAFVILSVISGKNPHYLIPIFPGLALAVAYLLNNQRKIGDVKNRTDLLIPALISIILGLIFVFGPELGSYLNKSQWTEDIHRFWGIPPIIAGIFLVLTPPQTMFYRITSITGLTVLIFIVINGLTSPVLRKAYDLKPLSLYLSELQKNGYAIANFGKYHGQYNFLGRLKKPIKETGQAEVIQWLHQNPRAKIISYYDIFTPEDKPDLTERFRSKTIAIWDRDIILTYPFVAARNSNGRRFIK